VRTLHGRKGYPADARSREFSRENSCGEAWKGGFEARRKLKSLSYH